MDELRRHAAPLVDRWRQLARGQRIAMIAVLIASSAGFFLLLNRPAENWQPVADGREFSTSELAAIRSAWRQAGLKSFRLESRKLFVPSALMDQFNAALPKSRRDDNDSDNNQSQSLANANLFTSHEQFEQLKDNALRNTVERQLKAIRAIADAEVTWARGKSRSAFTARSKVTATISVLPRDGHDLTPELAQSLRIAVAGMIPDLRAEDIVVLDQSTGLALADDSGELIVEQQLRQQQERLARQLESRIAAALPDIPDVTVQAKLVDVPRPANRHVAAKPTFGSTVEWATEAPDSVVKFSPHLSAEDDTQPFLKVVDSVRSFAWSVAVQIPQASFDAHLAQQLLTTEHRTANLDELCDAEFARLRLLVRNQLPPDATLAELSIIPRTVKAAATPHSVPFAALPHVLCGLFAALCLTAAARRWRADNALPASELSKSDSGLLGGLPLSVAPVDAAVIAPPTPMEPLTDITLLQQLNPQPLADAMQHERPQAIAVLLTHFPTRLASACLSRFSPALQADVILRLKSLGEIPDELVAEIARAVCERMKHLAETTTHEPTNRIAHLLPESPTQRVFA